MPTFIEVIVLIVAIKIHHFVSILGSYIGTPHSGIQRAYKEHHASFCDMVVIGLFSLPTPNFDFEICYFLLVNVVHHEENNHRYQGNTTELCAL